MVRSRSRVILDVLFDTWSQVLITLVIRAFIIMFATAVLAEHVPAFWPMSYMESTAMAAAFELGRGFFREKPVL